MGSGIAPADQAKIFEKFYRVQKSGPTHDKKGVGLGLALVKHVIDGHSGKIDVQSALGEGTTFTVRM